MQKSEIFKLSVAILALVVISVAITSAQDEGKLEQANGRLPPLFDFGQFKQRYRKHYGSFLEEVSRRAQFFGHALRVLASAVNYMHRRSSYYLAVNHMSDYTQAELDRMLNRMKTNRTTIGEDDPDDTDDQDEDITDEELDVKLAEMSANNSEVAELLREMRAQKRTRRSPQGQESADKQEELPLRRLDLNKLMGDSSRAKLPPETHVVDKVKSNNPHYIPVELESNGLLDQTYTTQHYFEDGCWSKLAMPLRKRKLRARIKANLDQNVLKRLSKPKDGNNDELFLDHTLSGCLDLPRDQGRCSACYAFAAIAMSEWTYCKKYGQLARFSEQYIVDCGRNFVPDMLDGCNSGQAEGTVQFVHNFGLELRQHYPYRAVEQQCPYNDENTPEILNTGYVRFYLQAMYLIERPLWQEYLYFAPLWVTLNHLPVDFLSYGGGVQTPRKCDRTTDGHSMVLVGYGKQDGVAYWKIRNSYSTNWGEEGYWRVARDSKNCLHKTAYAFGSADGENYSDVIHFNEWHRGYA